MCGTLNRSRTTVTPARGIASTRARARPRRRPNCSDLNFVSRSASVTWSNSGVSASYICACASAPGGGGTRPVLAGRDDVARGGGVVVGRGRGRGKGECRRGERGDPGHAAARYAGSRCRAPHDTLPRAAVARSVAPCSRLLHQASLLRRAWPIDRVIRESRAPWSAARRSLLLGPEADSARLAERHRARDVSGLSLRRQAICSRNATPTRLEIFKRASCASLDHPRVVQRPRLRRRPRRRQLSDHGVGRGPGRWRSMMARDGNLALPHRPRPWLGRCTSPTGLAFVHEQQTVHRAIMLRRT